MLQFLSREREQISSLHSQVATLRVTGAQDYRESIVNWLLVSGSNGSSGCGKWVLPTTAALQIDTSDHYRRCMANVWWWQQWYKWRCHHPSEVANYGASAGPASDYLDDGDTLQWVCNCSRSVCVCVCVCCGNSSLFKRSSRRIWETELPLAFQQLSKRWALKF